MTDIKFVINFDFPNNTEDYIHRIGRTARAEQTGTAYSFFTSSNAKQAREVIDVLKEAKQEINPSLYNMMELSKQMHMAKSTYYNTYPYCVRKLKSIWLDLSPQLFAIIFLSLV